MTATDWLAHVVVVDAGSTAATNYCGWLFVQNGAQVHSADAARSPQLSAAARDFLDTGKRVGDPAAAAHVVLYDADATGENDVRWRDRAPLRGIADTFGERGPRANWVADEVVLAAMGGAAAYTRGRAGEPVYGFGHRYQYLAGLYLFTSLVATLASGDDSEHEIRVSLLETVASLLPYPTTQYVYNGSESVLEQSGPRYVVTCRDGWVVVYAGLAWRALVGLLGRPDLQEDQRFVELGERFRHVEELGRLVDEWGVRLTVEEALRQAAEYDVAATAVRSPGDVLADPELHSRGAWHEVRGGGVAPTIPYLVVSEGVLA